MPKNVKNVLALFGAVILLSGLIAWQFHLPEGATKNSIFYALDSNYMKDLAPGTSGQVLTTQGSGSAPTWSTVALATSVGAKMSGGTVTLDGTNPSTAATGLTTISSCVLTDRRSATPGDEVTTLTYMTSGSTLQVYAWTTSGTDPTLLGSGDADDVIGWICFGT